VRNVSSATRAAIDAHERVIKHQVLVDYDNDGTIVDNTGVVIDPLDNLSHRIARVTTHQSLESSLPPAVRVVPGHAVAELDVSLQRGNIVHFGVNAFYRNITTNTSGNTRTNQISVARPSNVVGDVVLVSIMMPETAQDLGLPAGTNVTWRVLTYRGDGLLTEGGRVEGLLLLRRVGYGEPDTYTFTPKNDTVAWTIAAVAIGGANIAGVTDLSQKGQDDNTTAYTTVTTPPLTVDIPNSTVVSFFGAAVQVSGGVGWTPLDGDVERADFMSAQFPVNYNVVQSVMTHDSVARSVNLKRATLSVPATGTLAFAVTLAPLLAGDESQHAAWTFSELNQDSPYAGKIRTGRRTTWKVGVYSEGGLEYVPVFTGLSLDSGAQSKVRSARVSALDNRETFREPPDIPLTVAESPVPGFLTGLPNYPGLESTWVISYLFSWGLYAPSSTRLLPEQQGPRNGVGYFAAPAMRTNNSTYLWVPCHGSLAPFIGTIEHAYVQSATTARTRCTFAVGPYVAGTSPAPSNGLVQGGWFTAGGSGGAAMPWSADTGQIAGRIEFFARLSPSVTGGTVTIGAVESLLTPTAKFFYADITSAGVFRARLAFDGGITRTITGPSVPTDNLWHFYGVHVDSRTGVATFRIDATSTDVAFATWANSTPPNATSADALMTLTNGAQIADILLSGGMRPPNQSTGSNAFLASTALWANQFTPTAFIAKSENILDVLPVLTEYADVWDVVSAVAEAEFAAAYWDADGYPHYRTARSNVTPAGQIIQQAITARASLEDLSYSSGIAQVANYVTVAYSPVGFVVNGVVWQANGQLLIGSGDTVVITISLPGNVLSLSGSGTFVGNTSPDGSGSPYFNFNTSLSLGASSNVIIIQIDNLGNAFWLTSGQVIATYITPLDTPAPVLSQNRDSIRTYRTQPLQVSTSPWRQRADAAGMIAEQLQSDLRTPHPVFDSMPVKGDPTRELGDMVTVQDTHGIGVNGQFRITSIRNEGSPDGGFSQELVLRDARAVIARWNVNSWDDGSVWGVVS